MALTRLERANCPPQHPQGVGVAALPGQRPQARVGMHDVHRGRAHRSTRGTRWVQLIKFARLSVVVATVRTMLTTLEIPALTVDELEPALMEHFAEKLRMPVEEFLAIAKFPPSWSTGPAPLSDGVYVWEIDNKVLYIGSGCPLSRRLGDYDRWLAGAQPDSQWEVSVVYILKTMNASRRWVTTDSDRDALLLERRLIEWHRACTGIAPFVTGWAPSRDSHRWHGQRWARALWNKLHPIEA
jgi:hypothetical protein